MILCNISSESKHALPELQPLFLNPVNTTLMEPSILVVSSDDLFAILPDQIRNRTAFTVEVAANVEEARSWLNVRPPAVLIVQASLNGSLELCHWLKQQTKLAWIYCILVEDRPQIIAQRSQTNWNWEFETMAAALEESADAYVWLPAERADEDQLAAAHRLLLAQIQVGLRKVQKYRDLMQTNNALSALALADPLTELNNRRALEWDLPRQIRSSRVHKTPLGLLILDVDYFKVINDTYGHLVGDRILQLLSARVKHNLRLQDTPFRYGGEEFVILMRNTDCQGAAMVAQRLCRLISAQPFSIDDTLTINITISLGVASLRTSDDSEGTDLLARADQHLLQAKSAGRNRAVGCDHQPSATTALGQ